MRNCPTNCILYPLKGVGYKKNECSEHIYVNISMSSPLKHSGNCTFDTLFAGMVHLIVKIREDKLHGLQNNAYSW